MINLKIFSVSEYVEYLNGALYECDAVVEGEISEYKINQGKWIFFKVKDENSVLDCFGIVFKLKLPLEDGMRVRLYGRPKIYAKTGKLSMTVEWAEPIGEGALKRAYELLKAELEKEGLFARERKRPIPKFPARVGLIASKESAAYGDFVKVLKARFGGIEIYLYHTQVQGAEAVSGITEAFAYFNDHQKELNLDLIALVRGGGSWEDLAAFNSREVAYAVFGSLAPVVCGVGHEQDETIADFVADVRTSTPSNAAELIVPYKDDVSRQIGAMTNALTQDMEALHSELTRAVDAAAVTFDHFMLEKINRVENAVKKIILHLNFFGERIIMRQSKIDAFTRLIKSFSPQGVLERGYSIIRKQNKIISSVKDFQSGDDIEIKLSDGSVGAEVL